MPLGAGKYDDLASHVREQTEAAAVLVIVLEGKGGSGFSAQGIAPLMRPGRIAWILRAIAAEIATEEEG